MTLAQLYRVEAEAWRRIAISRAERNPYSGLCPNVTGSRCPEAIRERMRRRIREDMEACKPGFDFLVGDPHGRVYGSEERQRSVFGWHCGDNEPRILMALIYALEAEDDAREAAR